MPAKGDVRPARRTDAATNSMLHTLTTRLGHTIEDGGAFVLSESWAEALDDLATALTADEGALLLRLYETDALGRHLLPLLGVLGTRYASPKAGQMLARSLGALLDIVALFMSSDVESTEVPGALLDDCRREAQRRFGDSPGAFRALLDVLLGAVPRMASAPGGAFLRESADFYVAQRALQVVRNVLAVRSTSGSSHGRVLAALRDSKLAAFLGAAAGSVRDARDGRVFAPFAATLVEIAHCALSPVDPDGAARAHALGSAGDTEAALQRGPRRGVPVRHSRFSGAVSVRLATGEEYVLPSARLFGRSGGAAVPVEESLIDSARREAPRRRAVAIGGVVPGAAAPDVLAAADVARALMRDASLNELLAVAGTVLVTDAAVDDGVVWNLLGLCSWVLRFARVAGCGRDVGAALDAGLVSSVALLASREVADGRARRLPLVLSAALYIREVLRWLQLALPVSAGDGLGGRADGMGHASAPFGDPANGNGNPSQNASQIGPELEAALRETFAEVFGASKTVHFVRSLVATDALRGATVGMLAVAAEAAYVMLRIAPHPAALWPLFLTSAMADAAARLLAEPDDVSDATIRHASFLLAGALRVSRQSAGHALGRSPLFRIRLVDAAHGVAWATGSWRASHRDAVRVCSALGADFARALHADRSLFVRVFFARPPREAGAVGAPVDEAGTGDADGASDAESAGGRWEAATADWTTEERVRLHVRALVDEDDASFAVSYLASLLASIAAMPCEERAGEPRVHDVSPASAAMRAAWRASRFRALLAALGLVASNRKLCVWTLVVGSGAGAVAHDRLVESVGLVQRALADAIGSGPRDVVRPSMPASGRAAASEGSSDGESGGSAAGSDADSGDDWAADARPAGRRARPLSDDDSDAPQDRSPAARRRHAAIADDSEDEPRATDGGVHRADSIHRPFGNGGGAVGASGVGAIRDADPVPAPVSGLAGPAGNGHPQKRRLPLRIDSD